jgi:hypothetical protein
MGHEPPLFADNRAAARWWDGQDLSTVGHERKCQVVNEVWLQGKPFQQHIARHANVWRANASGTPQSNGKFLFFGITSSQLVGGPEPRISDQGEIALLPTLMERFLGDWAANMLMSNSGLKGETSVRELPSQFSSTGSVTWHQLRLPIAKINDKTLRNLVDTLHCRYAWADSLDSLKCVLHFRLIQLLGSTSLRALKSRQVERAKVHVSKAHARGQAIVDVLEAQGSHVPQLPCVSG